MMTSLKNRVERLERVRPQRSSLEDLPTEILENGFSLLLRKYVYGLTGQPTEELQWEYEAMGPLPPEPDPGYHIDEDRLHELVVSSLRADADRNEEYRRLLEMLEEANLITFPPGTVSPPAKGSGDADGRAQT
jgi:hypothetical protein